MLWAAAIGPSAGSTKALLLLPAESLLLTT